MRVRLSKDAGGEAQELAELAELAGSLGSLPPLASRQAWHKGKAEHQSLAVHVHVAAKLEVPVALTRVQQETCGRGCCHHGIASLDHMAHTQGSVLTTCRVRAADKESFRQQYSHSAGQGMRICLRGPCKFCICSGNNAVEQILGHLRGGVHKESCTRYPTRTHTCPKYLHGPCDPCHHLSRIESATSVAELSLSEQPHQRPGLIDLQQPFAALTFWR